MSRMAFGVEDEAGVVEDHLDRVDFLKSREAAVGVEDGLKEFWAVACQVRRSGDI